MKHGCRRLILHVFNEVVYITLKSEDMFYKLVSPLDFINHIANSIGGLEVTDVVALIDEIPTF